ncbi:MAG: hypothetical protein JRI26_11485 [Deltaproteobacteria bacterium]|nr:hypothetical protein [Deltaproteobacteria bacterium]
MDAAVKRIAGRKHWAVFKQMKNAFKDLGDLWVREALKEAKRKYLEATNAYQSLKNKETDYAKSINRLVGARLKEVEVWEKA